MESKSHSNSSYEDGLAAAEKHGIDYSIWRKIRYIPFKTSFLEEPKYKEILAKNKADNKTKKNKKLTKNDNINIKKLT